MSADTPLSPLAVDNAPKIEAGLQLLSTTALEERLRGTFDGLPVELLREVIRRKEEMVPALIRLVEAASRKFRAGEEFQTGEFGHEFALVLLTFFEATEAWNAIFEAILLPEDGFNTLYGDLLHETVPMTVVCLARDRLPDLIAAAKDKSVDEYVRWTLLTGIKGQQITGQRSRDETLAIFRDLLQAARESQDPELVRAILFEAADLQGVELLDDLQQAFDDGLIDPTDMGDMAGIRAEFESPPRVIRPWRIEDPIEELSNWTWTDREEEKFDLSDESEDLYDDHQSAADDEPFESLRDSLTIRNEGRHVGRNDLCPCGSGKKYKKCCGRGGLELEI